jgi:hypothetical protein
MANPWNKASQYDYTQSINNIIRLLEGKGNPNSPPPNNRFPNPNNKGQNQDDGGGNANPLNLPPKNPWQPNPSSPNSGQLDQQTLILIAGVALAVIFLMNQKDKPTREDYYD